MKTQVKIAVVLILGVILIPIFATIFWPVNENDYEWYTITLVEYTEHRSGGGKYGHTKRGYLDTNGIEYRFWDWIHKDYRKNPEILEGQTLEVLAPSSGEIRHPIAWKSNGFVEEGTIEQTHRKQALDFWVFTGMYLFFSLCSFFPEFIDLLSPLFSKIEKRKREKIKKRNRTEKEERKKRYEENKKSTATYVEYMHTQKNISRKKLKKRTKK